MNTFFNNLASKIHESVGTAKEIILHCNEEFKNKLENEATNQCIRYNFISNHSDFPSEFNLGGYNIKLDVDNKYDELKIEKIK